MSVLRFQGPVLPYGEVRDVYVVDGVVSHEPHPGVSVTASGWIVPGLVDAHCHMGLNDLGAAPEEETLEQAVANRDAGALLIRDCGSAADTRWVQAREDLPRLIRGGRHIGRTKSNRPISRTTHEQRPAVATVGSNWLATGSLEKKAISRPAFQLMPSLPGSRPLTKREPKSQRTVLARGCSRGSLRLESTALSTAPA